MVRAKWKPREDSTNAKASNPQIKVDKETMRGSSSKMDIDDDDDDSDDDMDNQDSDEEDVESQPPQTARQSFYSTLPKPDNARMPTDQDPEATPRPYASARSLPPDAADSLASTMSTLSLVPSSVRFGRGRGGGFVTASGRPAHQPRQASASQTLAAGDAGAKASTATTEIAPVHQAANESGENPVIEAGSGYRGRGRGGRGFIVGSDGNPGGRGGRGRGRGRGRGGRGG